MVNKSPFEVRLDVMKMAQEMLESETRTKTLKFKEKVEFLREIKASDNEILNFIENNAPASYTSDDVIARSSALYNFVSEKK